MLVQSSFIRSITRSGRGGQARTVVRFHNGTETIYDIPRSVHKDWLAAPSKGKFYHAIIRGQGWETRLNLSRDPTRETSHVYTTAEVSWGELGGYIPPAPAPQARTDDSAAARTNDRAAARIYDMAAERQARYPGGDVPSYMMRLRQERIARSWAERNKKHRNTEVKPNNNTRW